MEVLLLAFLVFWGGVIYLLAKKARAKGRSVVGIVLLSLIISPLFGWIVLLLMAPLPGSADYGGPDVRDDDELIEQGYGIRSDGEMVQKCGWCGDIVTHTCPDRAKAPA